MATTKSSQLNPQIETKKENQFVNVYCQFIGLRLLFAEGLNWWEIYFHSVESEFSFDNLLSIDNS